DLDADRPLALLEFGALERVPNPPADGLRREKLGQDHVGARRATDLAERRLGYSRHGRENQSEGMLGRIGQLHGVKILVDTPRGEGVGSCAMHLRELFGPGTVCLALRSANRDDVLRELVGLLAVDDASADTLLRALQRRESLGSTGVGRGIAIPHCRAVGVNKVRLAYGHRAEGVPYQAIDGLPVHDFFLIVAPPDEAVNMYLPVLGKIAQFAKDPDIPARLAGLTEPEQFLALLDEKGV